MGNITNLATTGNYTTEQGDLKVTFGFAVDNATAKLKTITGGQVMENDKSLADFNMYDHFGPENQRVQMNLLKGREVELATAIAEAISGLEAKIANGEAF